MRKVKKKKPVRKPKMNKDDLEGAFISEDELGITEMTDSLIESYQQSCKHHNADEKDLEYFQRYVFINIAMLWKVILNGK